MSALTSHTVDVPGARLYYEVQGSGPVLMLIGHPMDSGGFALLAPLLAQDYTVVTYDPRGFARSTIDDPTQDGEPDVLADDVRRVLEAVGHEPAHVFGSSGGAVTGLALVARFPGHVATLVAHEPPVALLLPDAAEVAEVRAGFHDIYETYREGGIGAAWQKFGALTGMTMGPSADDSVAEAEAEAEADAVPPSAEEMASSRRFFEHGLLTIALYQPDLAALQAAPTRLIVAGGVASKGELPQRTALALAERLGSPMMDFPGGHVGFITEPHEFAGVLRRALQE
ncbi:MAG TPA: alpha/beta hydrolase [Acidimicrobiales bacterium]|jgi:pimeloyl-ACP methyl ester carboxylesterase|nr:alpha/beta hydrolase [Acidimicrobiales bacterium]